MITLKVERPSTDEYGAFYAGYIQRVPDGDLFEFYAQQIGTLRGVLSPLTAEHTSFRPGPAEWSFKEVVGHVIDVERVFAYRALRISRNDSISLPGFEQDDYVRVSNFNERSMSDLLEEFELLRRANILAFNRLSPEASLRRGIVNNTTTSVRALLYMIPGHVSHHIASLQTEYLPKL